MEIKEVFERVYDNPKKDDGTLKESKKLGEFKILDTLFVDGYSGKWIGKNLLDSKNYLIESIEVCGYNGGSRFEVYCLDIEDTDKKHLQKIEHG